jgi:hypothetical protein
MALQRFSSLEEAGMTRWSVPGGDCEELYDETSEVVVYKGGEFVSYHRER